MTARNRWAAGWVCALAVVVLFGYAIARPATESLFLKVYGSEALPKVWLAVAAAAVGSVAVYNRFAKRLPLREVTIGVIAVSLATLIPLVLAHRAGWKPAVFLLYVWKDVHIVILLEGLWSFANLIFPQKTASWAYGLFCAAGSIGGMIGNSTVSVLAKSWGTAQTLWLLVPVFLLEVAVVFGLARAADHPAPKKTKDKAGFSDLRLLRDSRYLGWMLALIGLIQVVITLLDYVYNQAVAAAYPVLDERTSVIAQIYIAIDVVSISLQFATGLVLRAVGLKRTLLAIPTLLAAVVATFALHPRFVVMAVTKVASKAFDYSLFRAAKEMLYLPLSYAEKTRGKAIIDMLTYRVAKGGASLLLAGLIAAEITGAVLPVCLVLIVTWLAITVVVTRRHAEASASIADEA